MTMGIAPDPGRLTGLFVTVRGVRMISLVQRRHIDLQRVASAVCR
ncbi:putative leader peptide [Amycolatopsis taiwanensis]